MEFFVSWTDSDPEYTLYDANCSLLVSPPLFPRTFRLNKLHRLPKRVFLDSGAYTMRKRYGNRMTQRDVFRWQMEILEDLDLRRTQVLLSHFDQPIEPGVSPANAYRCMERTLAHAWDFLTLATREGITDAVELVGVVQGYDADSIRWCCRELRRLGFHRFGLGSLALLYHPQEIAARVQAAVEEVGPGLHVFGVSSVSVLKTLRSLGVSSFDSARPIKAAMFYVLLYSNPFRRYAVAGRRETDMGRQQLQEPLPCGCPVCREDPHLLLGVGAKYFTNLRAIHNYWHLKREVCGPDAWAEPEEPPDAFHAPG